MKKSKTTLISLAFLTLISLMTVLAPLVTRYSFEEQNISERLQSPSLQHWMGTDPLGRDLYSRIVYGGRMSLCVGVVTALLAMIFGTAFGSIAGYFGKRTDALFMRLADMLTIFPSPLLAILLMLVFGRGFLGIFIALGITAWITQARLVRGLVLQMREYPFIEAARAMGAGNLRIIFQHLLPNLSGPIITSLTIQIPTNMMAESFLSFIGLGLQPPYSSWGTLANEGFRAMQSYPHLIIFPSLVLFMTLLAFNFLADGLHDL